MARPRDILNHHRALNGTLRYRVLRSPSLGQRKPFYLYEPPGLATLEHVPIAYLFRGHEREWVNMQEDDSRGRTTAIEDLDRHITQGTLPPLAAVMPGLSSSNNHVPSLGVDMVGPWPETLHGLGTGRFWHYLIHDLIPHVERLLPQSVGGPRLAAGFSLGGYTAYLLGIHRPGYFDHVGIYDGLLMWPDHQDPRASTNGACTDPVWCEAGIFDAAFGTPRQAEAMRFWNPTDTLRLAGRDRLAMLRRTTFWIASAARDGRFGNLDRSRYVTQLLRNRQIPLGFDDVVFSPQARHTWHWTDRFLIRFLTRALAQPAAQASAA